MRYLEITQGMKEDNEHDLYPLCVFLGMDKESIEGEMFYFTNGEGFNWKGYTTSDSSETESVLNVGDVLVIRNGGYQLIPHKFTWLLWELDKVECFSDNLEANLHNIYEMGCLDRTGIEIYQDTFNM